MRVALTGGIATGKSAVVRGLQAAGFPTVSADAAARAVVEPGTPGLAAVHRRFGPAVLGPDGALDRAALGRLVFADPAARRDLERLLHPLIRERIDRFYAALPAGACGVAEIPLAYETGWGAGFDLVVVAACRPETQLARLQARDGLSAEDARQRIAAQWPIADKARLADAVVMTEGTMADTAAQTAALAAWLRSRPCPS
ncbi:MAG: dephospho-CoA kinase [Vicinamibacterales bacterium]